MDDMRAFEFKVGIFIMIGVAILFLIVFSIGDINISKSGYHIKVRFSFASGVGPASPIRLAGVGVGRVEGIHLVYDEKGQKTAAEVSAWIQQDAKIEEDATVTINTLGLLGEKYLEIVPGTPGAKILKNNDMITGKDPVPMEKVTENLASLSDSVKSIVDRLKSGEGTIGKLLTKDDIYNNLEETTKNFSEFSSDIRKHPWKLLNKPKGE